MPCVGAFNLALRKRGREEELCVEQGSTHQGHYDWRLGSVLILKFKEEVVSWKVGVDAVLSRANAQHTAHALGHLHTKTSTPCVYCLVICQTATLCA
ncbi:unnamed protein product [Citrullus colocynthis]|uniref:Uncharacterized protein n=1 Tax=Citrullus colocynthis TaxID=252529 RepID=A0ABP0Z772_9ROSI